MRILYKGKCFRKFSSPGKTWFLTHRKEKKNKEEEKKKKKKELIKYVSDTKR